MSWLEATHISCLTVSENQASEHSSGGFSAQGPSKAAVLAPVRWGPHLEAPLGRISLHLHELAGSIQFLPALELEGLSSSLTVDPKPPQGPLLCGSLSLGWVTESKKTDVTGFVVYAHTSNIPSVSQYSAHWEEVIRYSPHSDVEGHTEARIPR